MYYTFNLYVAGHTPNSLRAITNLKNLLEREFRGLYTLKIIDVLKNPQLAYQARVLATPTLDKALPPPAKRIIGDLSDRDKVLYGLDLLDRSEEEITAIPEEVLYQPEGAAAEQRRLAD